MTTERPPNPIKAWLDSIGQNAAWLAKNTGASAAQVSNWLRDKNGPAPDFKARILSLAGKKLTAEAIDAWALALRDERLPLEVRKKRTATLTAAA